jgi:hypothetical protein
MKTLTTSIILAVFGAALVSGDDGNSLTGSWSGDSVCVGSSPACKNEKVIYVFGKVDAAGHVSGHADKLVDGKRINMGDFEMRYDSKTSTLTWENPNGTWKYSIKGNEMEGGMTSKSGEVVRHVNVKKDKS